MSLLLILLSPSAFAGDPGTAGFTSKGFTVSDAAGKNLVNLGASFQPRLTATLSGDPDATDADGISDAGVRIRRMLLTANGTLAGFVDYRFRIDAAKSVSFSDADGKTQLAAKPILDDAQVVFRVADPFQVSVGQWKVPFLTQQMASDTTLLFPERALPVDGVRYGDVKLTGFTYSRDAGVAVLGNVAEKRVEYAVGAFDGDGTNVWPGDDGMLYVARVAVNPLGEFKYDEVDIERGKPRLGVGAGVTLNQHPAFDDEGARDGGTNDLRAAGDLRFAASGLSVNAEAMYGSVTAEGADPVRSLGFYAQAGYALGVGVAPGVRFARLDPSLDAEDDAVSHVEGVVNWYLPDPAKKGANLGHKVQLQAAWTTALQEGLDHPLYHQVNVASAVTF